MWFLIILPFGYLISYLLYLKGKSKQRHFERIILSQFDEIYTVKECKYKITIFSGNAMVEHSGKERHYSSSMVITSNEIIFHNNYCNSFLSFPEYKKSIFLFTNPDTHKNIEGFSSYCIKSINLNSFDNEVHIEAIYSSSSDTTVTIRIPNLDADTKDLINKIFG
jgi:hypothetical protein